MELNPRGWRPEWGSAPHAGLACSGCKVFGSMGEHPELASRLYPERRSTLNFRDGRDNLTPHLPPMTPKNPGKWGVAGCSVAK